MMELTKNEVEIMEVLWKEQRPLTGSEIVKKSITKTWKDSSIHILLNSLLKKEAIREVSFVRMGKGYARTFEPTESSEKYYADLLVSMARKTDVHSVFMSLFKREDISMESIEALENLIKEKKQELE